MMKIFDTFSSKPMRTFNMLHFIKKQKAAEFAKKFAINVFFTKQ